MKKITLITLSILISILSFAQPKVFKVKSGHIEYKMGGNSEGTKSFWWDNYGGKYRTLEKYTTTTKILGIKSTDEVHKLTIYDGEYSYSIDYINNQNTKLKLQDQMFLSELYDPNRTEEEQQELIDQTVQSLGGKIVGTETILGKKCDIVSIMGGKTWVYKNLSLKSEIKIMGIKTNEIATSIKENINIPASKFKAPAGIEFEEVGGQADLFNMMGEELGNSNEEISDSEEDDDNDDFIPLEITKDEFCNAINQLNSDDIKIFLCSEDDGAYAAVGTYKGKMLAIAPIHSHTVEMMLQEGQAIKNVEKFSINGKKAIFSNEFYDEEEGEYTNAPALMIEYKKHKLYLSIGGAQKLTKNDLINIAKQIRL